VKSEWKFSYLAGKETAFAAFLPANTTLSSEVITPVKDWESQSPRGAAFTGHGVWRNSKRGCTLPSSRQCWELFTHRSPGGPWGPTPMGMGFVRAPYPYRLGNSLPQDFPLPPPAPAYADHCPGLGRHLNNMHFNWGNGC